MPYAGSKVGMPTVASMERRWVSAVAEGQTVLHLAVESSNTELVKLLLENGSDHSRRDAEGENAAATRRDRPTFWLVLLGHGADIAAVENEGRSICTSPPPITTVAF